MKKLLVLFSVITFGLTLTSCLPETSNNFHETSIVYIDTHGFTTYGKTLTRRAIYNEKISIMPAKTFKFMSYSWDEDYGVTELGNGVTLYNVVTRGEVMDIDRTELQLASEDLERGSVISEIRDPQYDPYGVYFDDFWLFEYVYRGREGQKPNLSFYLRGMDEENDILEVDVRLDLTGEPKDKTTEGQYGAIVAVDMEEIRLTYLSEEDSAKEVDIKFYYYNSKDGDIVSSNKLWKMKKIIKE